MAKLGAMSTPVGGCSGTCVTQGVDTLRAPPRRADDDMDALVDAVRDIRRRRVGHGELHRDVGPGEVPEIVPLVEPADQLEVLGGLDDPADGRAHPAPGADHRDLDRAHAANCSHGAAVHLPFICATSSVILGHLRDDEPPEVRNDEGPPAHDP